MPRAVTYTGEEPWFVRIEAPDATMVMGVHAPEGPAREIASDMPVILYFHGTSGCLGNCAAKSAHMAKYTGAQVVAMEYPGYGRHPRADGGHPRADDVLANALALYDYCARQTPRGVYLVGTSLGTAVAAHVASQRPSARSLLLISPLMSAIAVLSLLLARILWWWDIFPTYRTIRDVQCRTLIVHGTADRVIPYAHAERLHSLLRAPARTGVVTYEGADHEDMFTGNRKYDTLDCVRFMTTEAE